MPCVKILRPPVSCRLSTTSKLLIKAILNQRDTGQRRVSDPRKRLFIGKYNEINFILWQFLLPRPQRQASCDKGLPCIYISWPYLASKHSDGPQETRQVYTHLRSILLTQQSRCNHINTKTDQIPQSRNVLLRRRVPHGLRTLGVSSSLPQVPQHSSGRLGARLLEYSIDRIDKCE